MRAMHLRTVLAVEGLEARENPAVSILPGLGFTPEFNIHAPQPGDHAVYSPRFGAGARVDVDDSLFFREKIPGCNVTAALWFRTGDLDLFVEKDEGGVGESPDAKFVHGRLTFNGAPIPDPIIVLLAQQQIAVEQTAATPTTGGANGLLYTPRDQFDLRIIDTTPQQPGTGPAQQPTAPAADPNDLNGDGFPDDWVVAPRDDDGLVEAPRDDLETGEPIEGDGDGDLETGEPIEQGDPNDANGDGFPDDWEVAPQTP